MGARKEGTTMAETRTLEREVLEGKVLAELQEIAQKVGVSGPMGKPGK